MSRMQSETSGLVPTCAPGAGRESARASVLIPPIAAATAAWWPILVIRIIRVSISEYQFKGILMLADDALPEQQNLQSIEVTGTALHAEHDISQSIDDIDRKELSEQHITLLSDALRNVPGLTLNSGEGGAHGDSVNLRGLSIPDSFFLDGVRDIGQYQRDTFNTDAVSVLLGPASAVFGRGSTSGVINSISKVPTLAPLADIGVSAGMANYWRG